MVYLQHKYLSQEVVFNLKYESWSEVILEMLKKIDEALRTINHLREEDEGK